MAIWYNITNLLHGCDMKKKNEMTYLTSKASVFDLSERYYVGFVFAVWK